MKFKNTFLTKQALYMPWNRLVTITLSQKKKDKKPIVKVNGWRGQEVTKDLQVRFIVKNYKNWRK